VRQLAEVNPDDRATAKSVDKSSSIRCLNPIMRDELLRVGGRFRHTSIGADGKNPIILPKEGQSLT